MTDEKRSLAISKNAAQQRRSREKWDEKKKQQQNASAKLRMQKMRARRKEAATPVNNPRTPSKSFPSAQNLGKAMKRVGNALPGSPRRQVCIVKRLEPKSLA